MFTYGSAREPAGKPGSGIAVEEDRRLDDSPLLGAGQAVRVALDDGDPRQQSRAEELLRLALGPAGVRVLGQQRLDAGLGSVEIPGSECQAKNAARATAGTTSQPSATTSRA